MKIKKGDFILGTEIWLVTKVYWKGFNKVYDIKSIGTKDEIIEVYNWWAGRYEELVVTGEMKAVPRNFLRHLGKLLPKEKAGNAIIVLFGETT